MVTRLRRHPFRQTESGLEKYCPGCEKFLLVKFFSQRRTGVRAGEYLSRCSNCICKPRVRHGQISGYVPLSKVWWIFDEITRRVGQQQASEVVGISANGYRRILYRRQTSVQRRNVYFAIEYLRCLRIDGTWNAPKIGRPLGYDTPYEEDDRCAECDGEAANYTSGCKTCMDRKSKRAQRLREQEGVMTLTRAQIVGLYGLVMNLPTDTKIEVLSMDDYGHAIVEAKSEGSGESKRYKLPATGGTELLG